jgi:hypothetical protein
MERGKDCDVPLICGEPPSLVVRIETHSAAGIAARKELALIIMK